MKKIMLPLSLLFISFLLHTSIFSQDGRTTVVPPSPPLPVEPIVVPPIIQVQNDEKSETLGLTDLDIDVKIHGFLAETKMTMTFYNPHNRVLAGDLYFPLPEGATISGYALDVHGAMVDGVCVEKDKARQVFEKEVRKGIDPGLVEWTKGNNFKTRVFPIPANGTRKIMIQYVSEIILYDQKSYYYLPLNYKKALKNAHIRMEVIKARIKPEIVTSDIKTFTFESWRDSFVAESTLQNITLSQDILIQFPDVKGSTTIVEKSNDGHTYFAVRDQVQPPSQKEKTSIPKKVTIVWDASHSRLTSNHGRETDLLRKVFNELVYVTHKGSIDSIQADLIIVRHRAFEPKTFQLPKDFTQLYQTIQTLPYDGGTQLSSITDYPLIHTSDMVLLFTDGISNFGKAKPDAIKVPVYVFNTSSTANHHFLRYLASSSGGVYFNMTNMNDDQVLSQIGTPIFSYLSAEFEKDMLQQFYPQIAKPVVADFSITGIIMDKESTLVVQYGSNGVRQKESRFAIKKSDAVEGEMLRFYWAQKKLDDLLTLPEENQSAITQLGKEHSIVTPNTSLLVLESLAQYVEHNVTPPNSLPDLKREFLAVIQQRQQEKVAQENKNIESVVALWENRTKWWNTEFKYPKNLKLDTSEKKLAAEESAPDDSPSPRATERDHSPSSEPSIANGSAARSEDGVADAEKAKGKDKSAVEEEVQATIELKSWDPQTPYIQELQKASSQNRFAVYMDQKKIYGTSPAFYLDCSDFFKKQGQNDLALQVLSNIAELELENPALLRVLGHRLAQLGYRDLAVYVFEEVKSLRPEEPQSFRDLALVFSDIAEELEKPNSKNKDSKLISESYRKALELLYNVVIQPWDRFAEIELIALMELNRIIPKAKAVQVDYDFIDKRLIKLLDLDMRITLTWDADLTDMDLHVIEPSQEEAYYGKNLTTIGGLVSRDFTQGYGPEEYIIHKAMKGKYIIKANYYSSSQVSLTGPVTLQLTLITNFARPNEKRETITIRLAESKDMFTVGEITF